MKKLCLFAILLFCISHTQPPLCSLENTQAEVIEQPGLTHEDANDLLPAAYQPEYKPAFFKMFFILFALLALVFLTFWIFKNFTRIRLHQANQTKSIKIIEKRAISPKSLLYLIEIEGKKIVVSESSLEVRKLKDME